MYSILLMRDCPLSSALNPAHQSVSQYVSSGRLSSVDPVEECWERREMKKWISYETWETNQNWWTKVLCLSYHEHPLLLWSLEASVAKLRCSVDELELNGFLRLAWCVHKQRLRKQRTDRYGTITYCTRSALQTANNKENRSGYKCQLGIYSIVDCDIW